MFRAIALTLRARLRFAAAMQGGDHVGPKHSEIFSRLL
jgi:hypothetical protein